MFKIQKAIVSSFAAIIIVVVFFLSAFSLLILLFGWNVIGCPQSKDVRDVLSLLESGAVGLGDDPLPIGRIVGEPEHVTLFRDQEGNLYRTFTIQNRCDTIRLYDINGHLIAANWFRTYGDWPDVWFFVIATRWGNIMMLSRIAVNVNQMT